MSAAVSTPAGAVAATAPAGGAPARRKRKGRYAGLWFVLPAAVVVVVFTLVPVLYGLGLSFTEYSPLGRTGPQPVGFDNYVNIALDGQLREAFGHALVLIFFYAVLPVMIGLVLAALPPP